MDGQLLSTAQPKPYLQVNYDKDGNPSVSGSYTDNKLERRGAIALLNALARRSDMGYEAFIDYVADCAKKCKPVSEVRHPSNETNTEHS